MNEFLLSDYTISIIGGIIVSIIIFSVSKVFAFFKRFPLEKKYKGYIGKYYIYMFQSIENKVFINLKINISVKYGKLYVEAQNEDIFFYTGTIIINERNIYIDLIGKNHSERMLLVFYSPLHKTVRKLIGVCTGITTIDEPFSSVCILSDERLTHRYLNNQFSNFNVKYKHGMLLVEKDLSLFENNIY